MKPWGVTRHSKKCFQWHNTLLSKPSFTFRNHLKSCGFSSFISALMHSVVALSCASALHVFCRSVLVYSPAQCLSSLYLSFLPSSWLEYWWCSFWIWLSPRLAESDSRHKYLGASKRETSWLKRTECRSGFYPWWKSMRLDRSQSDSTCQL